MVPEAFEDVPTDVVQVGYVRALQNPRERFRPVVPSGVSMAHYKVTAGTLAIPVRDRASGDRLLLSNNHVFANSNNAMKGDQILQPSPLDGGKVPGDVVATLERFLELNYLGDASREPVRDDRPGDGGQPGQPSGCDIVDALVGVANLFAGASGSEKRVQATRAQSSDRVKGPQVDKIYPPTTGFSAQSAPANVADCALARPNDPEMFSEQILNIGVVNGTKPAAIGGRIRKMGRTTGYTESVITLLNATVNVAYNTPRGERTARFTGQVIAEPMSEGGDSGALIVDRDENRAVGLLFAGSPLATIFTPIDTVLNALNITLG
jgi:hypothetical protein